MKWLVYIPALPSIILGHIFVLFTLAIRLTHHPKYYGPVLVAIHRKPRRYSTTIGHGIILAPDASSRTFRHEMLHTDQYEDECWKGLLIGGLCCIVSWKLGLILWATSGAPWLLTNYVTGLIRYKTRDNTVMESAYRGSSHERHAYSETR